MVHEVLFGDVFVGEFAGDAASAESEDAVGVGEDQFGFGGGEDDGGTVAFLLGNQFHDFGLGVNIHAARRFFQQQDFDRAEQPFGEDDLLLVASRE